MSKKKNLTNFLLLEKLKDCGISDFNSLTEEKWLNFIRSDIAKRYDDNEVIENIFNFAPITISCVDKNLKYVKVNEKMAQIAKSSAESFIGREVGETTKDESFNNFIKELFNTNKENLSKELHANVNGEDKYYIVNGSKYHNNNYAVIIGMDITLLKEYEKTAAFNEKMKDIGKLCSGVAHEINNPLQSINSFTELIEMDIEDLEKINLQEVKTEKDLNSLKKELIETQENIKDSVKNIKIAVKQASHITNSLRTFSRNTDEEKASPIVLKNIVNDAMVISKHKLDKVKLELNICCDEQLIFKAKEVQILQVLVNFLSNAVDAVKSLKKSSQWVKLNIIYKDDKLLFHFIDGGSGIPLDIQKNIFEAFFTTKESRKGTGLGLNICKNIVDEHGGSIKINNESKNTHFIIELPIRTEE